MTCIIGLAHEDKVYIGGDSMAADGWNQRETKLRKVFHAGQFLIGYTSSFRMGQILQYHLAVRQQYDNETDEQYMVIAFAETVRALLRDKGYARIESNNEEGGHFVVGYKSEVYHMASDYQINHYADGLVSVGCGSQYALGAMLALSQIEPDPHKRILKSLEVSADLCNGVMAPFRVETLP